MSGYVKFVVYDSETNEVVNAGWCPAGMVEAQAQSETHVAIRVERHQLPEGVMLNDVKARAFTVSVSKATGMASLEPV